MGEWKTVGLNELTDLLKDHYSSETFMVGVDSDNMIYYIVPTEMGLDPSLQIVEESVEIDNIFGVLGAKGFPRGIYLWIEDQASEEDDEEGGLLDDDDLGDLMSGSSSSATQAPAGEIPRPPVEKAPVLSPPSDPAPPKPTPDIPAPVIDKPTEPEPDAIPAPPAAADPKPVPAPPVSGAVPAPGPVEIEIPGPEPADSYNAIPDFVPQSGTPSSSPAPAASSAGGDDDDMEYMVKELQKLREKIVPLEERIIQKEDELEFMKGEFETLQTFIHNHFIEFGGDPLSLPEDTLEKVELIGQHIKEAQKAVHEDLEQQRKMLMELEKSGGSGSGGDESETVADLQNQLQEARSSNKALMEQLMKSKSESKKQIAELERRLKEAGGSD